VEDTTVREGEKEGNRGAGRSGGRWRAPESGRRGSRAASAGDPLEQVPAPHRRSRTRRRESLRRRRRFLPGRAVQVQATAGEGTGWSEGAARNPPATSGCAAQRPVLPPRQHKGERGHHGRPRLPPRQRWTGSSTMASMADGEVRHDMLLLDTLRWRTNKIRYGNRRGRCPRRRSTWVISPGAR